MKDPKVTELVKKFNKEVGALNETWLGLQKHNVYVRVDLKGTNTYDDPKYIEIKEITQRVSYIKEDE